MNIKKNVVVCSRLLTIVLTVFFFSCIRSNIPEIYSSVPPYPEMAHPSQLLYKGVLTCEDNFVYDVVGIAGTTVRGKLLFAQGFGQNGVPRVVVLYNRTDSEYMGLWIDHTNDGTMDEFFRNPDEANAKYGSACGLLIKLLGEK